MRNIGRQGGLMPAASNQHVLPRRAIFGCDFLYLWTHLVEHLHVYGRGTRRENVLVSRRPGNEVENNRVSVLTQNIEWQNTRKVVAYRHKCGMIRVG